MSTWNIELGFDSRSCHKSYRRYTGGRTRTVLPAAYKHCYYMCILFVHHGAWKKKLPCLQVNVKHMSCISYCESVCVFSYGIFSLKHWNAEEKCSEAFTRSKSRELLTNPNKYLYQAGPMTSISV